jgi:hypothetical protein
MPHPRPLFANHKSPDIIHPLTLSYKNH